LVGGGGAVAASTIILFPFPWVRKLDFFDTGHGTQKTPLKEGEDPKGVKLPATTIIGKFYW
jgi:hypothetical protein